MLAIIYAQIYNLHVVVRFEDRLLIHVGRASTLSCFSSKKPPSVNYHLKLVTSDVPFLRL